MNCKNLRSAIANFLREEDGPTAVEYAIMMALILAVCIVSINNLADKTKGSYDNSATAISTAIGP